LKKYLVRNENSKNTLVYTTLNENLDKIDDLKEYNIKLQKLVHINEDGVYPSTEKNKTIFEFFDAPLILIHSIISLIIFVFQYNHILIIYQIKNVYFLLLNEKMKLILDMHHHLQEEVIFAQLLILNENQLIN
jgi:hypothetical protein